VHETADASPRTDIRPASLARHRTPDSSPPGPSGGAWRDNARGNAWMTAPRTRR